MRKFTILLVFALFSVNTLVGQIVKFNFNTNPYLSVSVANTNLSVSDVALSSGTISTNVTTGTYFTDEPYIEESGGWTATDVHSAKYFFITINALSGYKFSISNISFDAYATSAGPAAVSILINSDSVFTFDMPDSDIRNISKSITQYNDLTSVTIKIAGWDNGSRTSSGGGAFRLDNLTVDGTVEQIPQNDSSSVIFASNFACPQNISSLINSPQTVQVFEFCIADSASGDSKNTIIDSIVVKQTSFNTIDNWIQAIDTVFITSTAFLDTIAGIISENRLIFNTIGKFTVYEGVANADTCKIFLSLKNSLQDIDNKNFNLNIDSTTVFCNSDGSKVGYGNIMSEQNSLTVKIIATKLQASLSENHLWKDSAVNIIANAVDLNGNTDTDETGTITLQLLSGNGNLQPESSLSGNFVNGSFTFQDIRFSGADTASIKIVSQNTEDYTFENLLFYDYCFADNFENNNLQKWTNTDDWTVTAINPLDGNYSLKHNLSDVSGISYTSSKFDNTGFNTGKTVWQFTLKNGNFDPSSTNKFWYFLMASDSNLTRENICGYVAGVNFSGSNDTLSLWRIDTIGNKTLLIKSDFNWNAENNISVKVIRDASGKWDLAYSTDNENFVFSNKITDTTYNNLQFHGIVFKFSTTRAGQLWCDNIFTGKLNTPPVLLKAEGISDSLILLQFSEPLLQTQASNIANYRIESASDNSVTITDVSFNGNFPERVILKVNRLKTAKYTIYADNISDLQNETAPENNITFNYTVPAKLHDIVFTEIMFDPYPAVKLPETDYFEIYNRSENPVNLKGWKIDIGGVTKTFPDTVIETGEYITVTAESYSDNFSQYGKTVGIISSSSLTNSGKMLKLISTAGAIIDSIKYSQNWITDENKQDGGWAIERIDVDNLCGTLSNWTVSIDEKGGTPCNENSVATENIDTKLPEIKRVKFSGYSQIKVEFSEFINVSSATAIANYAILQNSIDSVIIADDLLSVNIWLKDTFASKTYYNLQVKNISDLCGNIIKDTAVSMLFYIPEREDIVINEIMADPTPSVELPETQYIELYNRSNYPVDLSGWEIKYQIYSREFTDFVLYPDKYLLLCPEGRIELLEPYGDVMDILSLTTLSTTGKLLQIVDSAGNIITEVNYNKNWYNNPDKDNGGWAIERIDYDNLCGTFANWTASENPSGGTPCAVNSVYRSNIDTVKPAVVYDNIADANSVIFKFSEPVNEQTALFSNNYRFVNSQIEIDTIYFADNLNMSVKLSLKTAMQPDNSYSVSIKNISDLCGNILPDTTINFSFNNIYENDIVITEIMADPSPAVDLPEQEYIEIYNRSNKTINLEGWHLAVNGSKGTFSYYKLKPDKYLLLVSNSAFEDFDFTENKIALQNFRSLPNTSGTLQLFDNNDNEINRVDYSEKWYHDSEKDNGGWSLEIIDPDNQCGKINNWTASVNSNGGTPAYENSVFAENIDNTKPFVSNFLYAGDSSLLIVFSELIDTATVSNFTVNNTTNPQKIIFDTKDATKIRLDFNDAFVSKTDYQLKISGISDFCDNAISDTIINFNYFKPDFYEIIINEIMTNPVPSAGLPEVEYIELYNRSCFEIRAYNMQIAISKSVRNIEQLIIPAKGYVILCNADYINSFDKDITVCGVDNLPQLSQNGDIKIIDNSDNLICRTQYYSSWIDDDFKADGGYSLERIDFKNPDDSKDNWQASNNSNGGTPGFENSVYKQNPDEILPNATTVFPVNDTIIGLGFSEPVSFENIHGQPVEIEDEPLMISSYYFKDYDFTTVYLTLKQPLESGVEYTFLINDSVIDLSGNLILKREIKYSVPVTASPNDVVINEIMFNPLDGGVDFVEIYNKSAFPVNLKQFLLANYDNDGNMKNVKRVSQNGAILFPENYLVLSEDGAIVKKQYRTENPDAFYDVEDLPPLASSNGSVVLLDTSGTVIDYMYYSDDMHFKLLQNTKGVSLERINYNVSSLEKSNWHSAAEAAGWATPGYKNSMFIEKANVSSEFSISPDVFSPDNDGYDDVLYINYKFDMPGKVANIIVFDIKGRKIKTIAENELLAVEGTFSWDGLNDNNRLMPIGIYIIYFEIYDLDGNISKYKKVCAINARFK